jgi:DNA-binding MarR family transcriptional regulator
MGTRAQASDHESLARALVALQRYSVDITQIAAQSLGDQDIENTDIQMVLTVHRSGPLTPTEIAQRMAAPRSTVARALNRLDRVGLPCASLTTAIGAVSVSA